VYKNCCVSSCHLSLETFIPKIFIGPLKFKILVLFFVSVQFYCIQTCYAPVFFSFVLFVFGAVVYYILHGMS